MTEAKIDAAHYKALMAVARKSAAGEGRARSDARLKGLLVPPAKPVKKPVAR
jgi:hypothetical protein